MTPVREDPVALFHRTKELEIETRSAKGERHRVIIWVVVVDGDVYAASYRAKRGRWWREITASGEGALVLGRRHFPVRAVRVRSEATKRAISAAFGRKYQSSAASLRAMQTAEVLDTAVRLTLGADGSRGQFD